MFFLLPQVAYAAENINQLVMKVSQFVLNPIIVLMFLVALIYFVWGLIVFMKDSKSPEGRTKGGDHIRWGLVGMFIMISVFTLLEIGMSTLNVTGVNLQPVNGEFVDINF
jgi:hypothetical protein